MTTPAFYTEKTLADYMVSRLGSLATVFTITVGATDAGDLTEVVNDVQLALGVTNISALTSTEDLRRLRALATVAMWQYVVSNFVGLYDFTADGETYKRSQLFQQASAYLSSAMSEWLALDSTLSAVYAVRILPAKYIEDPYQYSSGEENEA